MKDKIIQVNGFGVRNTMQTQCEYMLVALTESGDVLMSTGDGLWGSVGPKEPENLPSCLQEKCHCNPHDVVYKGHAKDCPYFVAI